MLQQLSSKHTLRRAMLCCLVIAIALPAHTLVSGAASSSDRHEKSQSSTSITGASMPSACVAYDAGGVAGCRLPKTDETETISQRDTTLELRDINAPQLQSAGGLQITLRATPALEANPAAKAAFLRAADAWASRVQSPTLINIDVDFSPTWFGQKFPQGVIGITNPQMLIGPEQYFNVVSQLMDSTSDSHELSLYGNLPQTPVPTDLGETVDVLAPSAVYRTLGMINPDPNYDPQAFGPPPAIGLNSAVDFDFDPSDGIDPDKYDFEGLVTHEIGHVLGFVSAVGQRELNPKCDLAVTVWDLFRLRPGATMGTLPTADRILSSGGAQVFYEGSGELQLSTGRPDNSGLDGLQPSHWRDDSVVGQRIGLMDPALMPGTRATLTITDLAALDLFGYTLKPFGNNHPAIGSLSADLNGDVLSLKGAGADADGDVVQAQATFLDQKSHALSQTAPFSTDFGIVSKLSIDMKFTGMGGQPDATQISLVLIDSRGNRSTIVTADFSGGDPGAQKLTSASYDGSTLTIKGKRLTADTQVEMNGKIVAPPGGVTVTPNGKKLFVNGTSQSLNLLSGSNRVRVISGGLRSSLLIAPL
jgi:hypothetical protein